MGSDVTGSDLEAVQKRHEAWILGLPNVVSVGIGERSGRSVIQVGVTRKVPISELRPDEVIPSTLEGVEVDVAEVGSVTVEAQI
jgi:hypothetical protein